MFLAEADALLSGSAFMDTAAVVATDTVDLIDVVEALLDKVDIDVADVVSVTADVVDVDDVGAVLLDLASFIFCTILLHLS